MAKRMAAEDGGRDGSGGRRRGRRRALAAQPDRSRDVGDESADDGARIGAPVWRVAQDHGRDIRARGAGQGLAVRRPDVARASGLQAHRRRATSRSATRSTGSIDGNPDWRKRERARFLTGILTSAMAPTNTLIGNPAALKKAYETGGKSLVRGVQNLIDDVRHNKGMPSQVKRSDFKVGENLAATPGAVVLRTERFELLQYQPTTAEGVRDPDAHHSAADRQALLHRSLAGTKLHRVRGRQGLSDLQHQLAQSAEGAGRLGHRRLHQVDARSRRRRVQHHRQQESEHQPASAPAAS